MAIGVHIPLRFLSLTLCIIGLARDVPSADFSAERQNVEFPELYQYTSAPANGRNGRNQESVTMIYHRVDNRVECLSRTIGKNFTEEVEITLSEGGNVNFAKMKKTSNADREILRHSLIWADNQMVHVETTVGTKKTVKKRKHPKDQKLAVDLSLLYQMRFFPFGKSAEWRVFMADFSGHFITVSIRDRGVERITVPAGAFECYRMEAAVGLFFLKTKIIYWLTTNPPHFLVKHQGKRGPFTKTYITVLNSMGSVTK
jgi:hypothetical protein